MSARHVQYMSARQWAQHRQQELTRLHAKFAAAAANGIDLEPSAPEGHHCDFCDGSVVSGVCDTCEAVFVDGVRAPGDGR